MAFSIIEVHQIEPDRAHARLLHGEQSITVILRSTAEEIASLPPLFCAELDYTSVVRHDLSLPRDDNASGLSPTDDDAVTILDGTVITHVEIESDHVLIDVYLRAGPEFLTLTSEDLDGTIPPVGSRIRVWLLGLSVHPSTT